MVYQKLNFIYIMIKYNVYLSYMFKLKNNGEIQDIMLDIFKNIKIINLKEISDQNILENKNILEIDEIDEIDNSENIIEKSYDIRMVNNSRMHVDDSLWYNTKTIDINNCEISEQILDEIKESNETVQVDPMIKSITETNKIEKPTETIGKK